MFSKVWIVSSPNSAGRQADQLLLPEGVSVSLNSEFSLIKDQGSCPSVLVQHR